MLHAKLLLNFHSSVTARYFSAAVATEESRLAFVNNILTVYTDFDLDGVDIDWEYPGRLGARGNKWNPNDADNLFLFLQLLRSVLPPSARISAAAETTVFTSGLGTPMTNASHFATVLDWVLLMNYDVWDCKLTKSQHTSILTIHAVLSFLETWA